MLAGLVLTPLASRAEVESKDPIKIALFDWTSVNLNAKILGGILESLAIRSNIQPPTIFRASPPGLTNGDLTVGMEYLGHHRGEAMKASDQTKQTERLGKLGPKAKEEWWYPLYMKEELPGLPELGSAEGSKCAEAFSTPETRPKGAISAAR
jgi:glycine betaine/proline transport system substrate-binding protein